MSGEKNGMERLELELDLELTELQGKGECLQGETELLSWVLAGRSMAG